MKPKSTIANLPIEIRDRVNRDLLANRTYAEIAAWLTGERHVTSKPRTVEVMLSNWYRGGFKAWRTEQLERDDLVRLVDNLAAQMGNVGGDVALLKSMMLESVITIRSSDAAPDEKANAFAQVSREIARHAKNELAERRLKMAEAQLEKVKEVARAAKAGGGLTAETLKQIEEAAGLL